MTTLTPAGLAPVEHASVWSAESMRARTDWLHRLSDAEIADLDRETERLAARAGDLLSIGRADVELPVLAPRLERAREEVLHGRGFVQIRGLPVERYDRRRLALAFWCMGRLLGDEFASQNAKGHLLGHVTDLGESRANADQRGPYSRETIPFHVDCCDIVGLLCLHPARRGGASRVASSGHVYNTMLERHPELVEPLTRPIYRDRRGEIPPGMEPWYAIPVFNHFAGLLSVNIEPTYIGSVARHFGGRDPHSTEQLEAIRRVQDLAAELSLDIDFEAGDVQLVHNHTILHSREGYEDHPEPERRRHLLRLWMINHDARPLPDAYYERHGPRHAVARPGGIVGAGTVPIAPLP